MGSCFTKMIKKYLKMERHKSVADSWHLVNFIRVFMGAKVIAVNIEDGDDVKYRFNYLGFVCFMFWYLLYFYSSYIAYVEDQTVLRILYDSKLKQYGDILDNVMSFVFVLYVMWKVPFDLNGLSSKSQDFFRIDKAIENMGEPVDFTNSTFIAFITSILQLACCTIKMFILWMILKNIAVMPYAKMFQIVYTEMSVVMIASYYCVYLMHVRKRYKIVNKVLKEVKNKNSREYLIFVRERRVTNEQKALQIQDKYVCEKIKTCANIYSMLFCSADRANKMFGFALVLTMLVCMITDTVHLFYLMEATASGLFHNVPRYFHFVTYVGWKILVATSVIYVMVLMCELTVAEAKATGFVIHQIINNNDSPVITSELSKLHSYLAPDQGSMNCIPKVEHNLQAMQLSLQILHQVPVFTARGLYKMDYVVVLEGARSVVAFLVMLIQFVTDSSTSL